MGKRLQKLRTSNNYLSSENFNGKPELALTVDTEPELVSTDYGQKYEIKVTNDGKTYTWQMNATSSDFLDETFKENSWKGQKITAIIVDQVVEGKMRKVIYAKGSI